MMQCSLLGVRHWKSVCHSIANHKRDLHLSTGCLIKNEKRHSSIQYPQKSYDEQRKNSFNIQYPKKSLYPQKHIYDAETHKKYAKSMAYLKSKKRKGNGVFVENRRMISDLLAQGQKPSYVFFVQEDVLRKIPELPESTGTIQVTERQMSRLTDVAAPQGIMAVFDLPSGVACHKDAMPLIIYLDRLQDPGNIGTIVRSAAGAACTSVITSPRAAGLWLPATLRASAAAHFLIPLHQGLDFREVLDSIPPEWNICFVESKSDDTTRKDTGSIPYYEADFTQPTIMVFGREGGGLSLGNREVATRAGCHSIINTYIPTIPELDSLNVGMAATVLIYEMAKQQRTLVRKETCAVLDNLSTISNRLQDVKVTNTTPSEVAQELETLFPPQEEEEELQEEQEE